MRLNRSIELPVLTPDEHATIRAALDARGFNGVSVPEATADIDFSNAVFTDPVWFDGFVFGGETNFKGARFDGQINSFGNAIFFGNVNMDDAAWTGDLIGERMTFVLSASFERATFQSRAAFGSTNFHWRHGLQRCTFPGGCEFQQLRIRRRRELRGRSRRS